VEINLKRYTLDKQLICEGKLFVSDAGKTLHLRYVDSFIDEEAFAEYHLIVGLEILRTKLEQNHNSVLNCMGCRKDTSYRATGHFGGYLVEEGKQATIHINIFDPTDRIDQLATVDDHKTAYRQWLNSLSSIN